jgi:hypothetical protein
MRLTVGMLRQLTEVGIPVRKPQTPEQKKAMLGLVKWAGDKMGAGPNDLQDIFAAAQKDDWSEAMDFLRTYYVMKGIKVAPSN